MKPMAQTIGRGGGLALLLALSYGCSGLLPKPTPLPAYYSLSAPSAHLAQDQREHPKGAPALIISPPRAAAGFDSRKMIYVRQAHQLEYFAHNQWVDTPARMLAPLLVARLAATPGIGAVFASASGAASELRLDTEILQLQHDFSVAPSEVRFVLRAYLVDGVSREVIAIRDFDRCVESASANPYGGVVAANRAVGEVLDQLSGFVAEALRAQPQRAPKP